VSSNQVQGLYGSGEGASATSGGVARGGGIDMGYGILRLEACSVEGNVAKGGLGASYEVGHFATSGGSAAGGGVYIRAGTARITNCAFLSNSAQGGSAGGATRNVAWGGSGGGAGLFVYSGNIAVVNCTFSSNTVTGGSGSGCSLLAGGCASGSSGWGAGLASGLGNIYMAHCTITKNQAVGGGAGGFSTAGAALGSGIYNSQGTLSIANSIVAGNYGTNDCYGQLLSQGYNIFGITNGFSGLTNSDLYGVDPVLGPLQDNGGPTLTHALLSGSPAIDAGGQVPVLFDQRGQPRLIDYANIPNAPGGNASDIGAFESDPVLRCTGLKVQGNDVLIKFTSLSDLDYSLQYRSNLPSSVWLTIPGSVRGSGGIVTATNYGAASLPKLFYRIQN